MFNFVPLINNAITIGLYIYFKRFFLCLKRLSGSKVALLTKEEYGSAIKFL